MVSKRLNRGHGKYPVARVRQIFAAMVRRKRLRLISIVVSTLHTSMAMAAHLKPFTRLLQSIYGVYWFFWRNRGIDQVWPRLRDSDKEVVTFGLGNFEVLMPFGGVLVQFLRIDTHPTFDTYKKVKLGVNNSTVLVGGRIRFRVYWQYLKFYTESYKIHPPGREFDHPTGWLTLGDGAVPSTI